MKVTIKDVAKKAGVATSTVSRSLQDHKSISEATKLKVRKAAKELGYVPNAAAQNLSSRSTKNIGIILPQALKEQKIQHPFFMNIIEEISYALTSYQYTATITAGETVEDLLANVKMMTQQKRVDGFLMLYAMEDDPVVHYLSDNDIPFVVVGHPKDADNHIRYVDNDNIAVGRTATKVLIDNGHSQIVFVSRNKKEVVHNERYDGYQLEMNKHNLDYMNLICTDDPYDMEVLVDLLENKKITGIVACDDMHAIKLIPLLLDFGYEVGKDISLVGINNSLFATLFHPYLTTVDINVDYLARESAKLIVELLNNKDLLLVKHIIPHEIIIRETVAKLN